jgi:hypothetical protein
MRFYDTGISVIDKIALTQYSRVKVLLVSLTNTVFETIYWTTQNTRPQKIIIRWIFCTVVFERRESASLIPDVG